MIAPSFLLFLINIILFFWAPTDATASTHHIAHHRQVHHRIHHVKHHRRVHPHKTVKDPIKPQNEQAVVSEPVTIKTESAPSLNPNVLQMALHAAKKADTLGIKHRDVIAIIDYSMPSTEKRLWVLNLNNKKVHYQTLVAHGKGTGENLAAHFSNQGGSRASSLGLFVAGKTYFGHHGYSLRINGLEQGINDNAFRRDVVIHAADYATPEFLRTHGRLGRSWGCPAVPPTVSHQLINTLKNGALIFAYFPDRHWLRHSRYLA